jgi:hypothetical protein
MRVDKSIATSISLPSMHGCGTAAERSQQGSHHDPGAPRKFCSIHFPRGPQHCADGSRQTAVVLKTDKGISFWDALCTHKPNPFRTSIYHSQNKHSMVPAAVCSQIKSAFYVTQLRKGIRRCGRLIQILLKIRMCESTVIKTWQMK